MPLPPEIDELIRKKFEKLTEELYPLVESQAKLTPLLFEGIDNSEFFRLQTNSLSLLQLLSNRQSHIPKLIDDVRRLSASEVDRLYGMVLGLKSDYEDGMLESLTHMVEAEITSDYLDQAEQLLAQTKKASLDHIPAAVLTGAILEDNIRRLCQRQNPAIPIKAGKNFKKLNTMIDDLKKAGVYNELKAKQLRAWADIRNAAAHGQFEQFNNNDVEQMLAGVRQFLTEYA